jgi:pyrimidine deaminase RibD-like protein
VATLSATDLRLQAETLEIASQPGQAVPPDPFVGAILADPAGRIVGRGSHAHCGGLHAEPVAIAEAGAQAAGATLYCNLEPCSYEAPEKRQPPCTRAIIEAGVARVVVGQIDPHPRVRGGGVRRLRDAGITVELAPDPLPFWLANPVFTTVMALGRPLVHVVTSGPGSSDTLPLWHDAEVEDRELDGANGTARSILLRSDDPDEVQLPDGWHIDFLDGRPSARWEQSLRDATSGLG